MAIKIRNNPSIKGLTFDSQSSGSRPFKIFQYADDTSLTLRNEIELYAALNDIELFSAFSGLKLNRNKSHGMWVGNSKYITDTPGDINWVPLGGTIKILGIYFSATKEASDISQNWDSKIDNIKQLICRWQRRNLSLYGKIIICKTFLLSQISYTIQALAPQKKLLTL